MTRDALAQALRALPPSARRPLAPSQLDALDRAFRHDLPPVVRDYLSTAGAGRGPSPLLDLTDVRAESLSPFAFTLGTWLRDAGQILDVRAAVLAAGGSRKLVPLADAGKGKVLCARRRADDPAWDAEVLAWDDDLAAGFVVADSFARWVRREVLGD